MNPVADAILSLVGGLHPGKSICPSEVARLLAPEPPAAWRSQLGRVRQEAVRLARDGKVEILRKGRPVSALAPVRGVIRLRAPRLP